MAKPIWKNDNVSIYGNSHNVPIINGCELSDKEKKDFDFLKNEDLEFGNFFRYKKSVYYLGEIMRIAGINPFKECPIHFDGYFALSAFWGILVTLSPDGDYVKVYSYCS